MEKLLCPSLMCCDIGRLESELNNLEKADIDIFHIDVMDGHYVPNLGSGLQEIEYVVANTSKKTDVHLMVTNPDMYIDKLCELGIDIIYIHPETTNHPIRTLCQIAESGSHPGIAISPNISIKYIKELFPYVSYILVMTVSPGFAGQKYLDSIDMKIQKLLDLKQKNNFKVLLDGAIGIDKVKQYCNSDVDGYILGTSLLFGKEESYAQIIKKLKELNE